MLIIFLIINMESTPNHLFSVNEFDLIKNILDIQEFYLTKEGIIYKIIIGKNKEQIFIQSKKYFIKFNLKDFSFLIKTDFNSIDKVYEYIINLFEENQIFISDIKQNESLILKIQEKNIEFLLTYNLKNSNYIMNDINNIKKDINLLKEENKILKKEINKLKELHFNSNPEDIKYLSDICEDSFAFDNSDNSFTVFQSINYILYLIYSKENKSIICYDLEKDKKIKEIKNSHEEYISNFRHYLDEINQRDLIISISCQDNNIKLWNAEKWECILNLKNTNDNGLLYSAYLLNENKEIFLITSNCNWRGKSESMKIFNLMGQKLKEIENSDENVLFIDTYYEKKNSKIYLLTGNRGYIKSYDYNLNQIYHKYCDNDNNNSHLSIIAHQYQDNGEIKLIESCNDGNIRIWNFHTGTLLNIIYASNKFLRGICLWDNDYLIIID